MVTGGLCHSGQWNHRHSPGQASLVQVKFCLCTHHTPINMWQVTGPQGSFSIQLDQGERLVPEATLILIVVSMYSAAHDPLGSRSSCTVPEAESESMPCPCSVSDWGQDSWSPQVILQLDGVLQGSVPTVQTPV
jgi:hypothetical protein